MTYLEQNLADASSHKTIFKPLVYMHAYAKCKKYNLQSMNPID